MSKKDVEMKEEKKEEIKKDPVDEWAIDEEDLSEEDKHLKDNLDMLVERLQDTNIELQKTALNAIKNEVRDATSSMTSVPKPLKFLKPHYSKIKEIYEQVKDEGFKKAFADVLSVLAMTMSEPNSRESLSFVLKGTHQEVTSWGHEYLKCLSGEIADEYAELSEKQENTDNLLFLVEVIAPYNMQHNSEPEAVDLLMEVEQLPKIVEFTNENNYSKVCKYLEACSYYSADAEEMIQTLETAYKVYKKNNRFPEALRIA